MHKYSQRSAHGDIVAHVLTTIYIQGLLDIVLHDLAT